MANSSTIRGRLAAVCAASLVALAGCGQPPAEPGPAASSDAASNTPVSSPTVPDRQPRTLVLKATGSAKVTAVRYTLDRRVRKKGAASLPWRKSVTVPADGKPHSWRLDVTFTGNGAVNLVAIFEGDIVAQGGSAGSGNVKGNASVGGTVSG